jgi:glycosyltransferase involved in cell wall biosynthesis
MTIGLEAERANLPNPTGVERFAAELIKELAKIDQTNNYILYFRTQPKDWFYKLPSNFKCKVMPFPKFWTQIRLSWEMLTHPVDVLVILASALPFYHPKNSIVTVHDIAFEFFPEAFPWFMRNYLIWSTRFAVKHSAKVIAVSQATKGDLVKHYNAPEERIAVIHLGKGDEHKPLKYGEVQPVLDKHGLVYEKYALFLGTMQPRKNIQKLIDAWIKLKKDYNVEETLVIAGGKGWLWEPIVEKIEQAGVADGIKHLGYVDDADLPALYSGAKLLTLPALYEGFGLPPLEAMAFGTPVVVSNISSLPEVVGDAGKLVDPNSVDSIAEGLLEVLTDADLRKQMMVKGLEQSKKFTWPKTAKETLDLIESLK